MAMGVGRCRTCHTCHTVQEKNSGPRRARVFAIDGGELDAVIRRRCHKGPLVGKCFRLLWPKPSEPVEK